MSREEKGGGGKMVRKYFGSCGSLGKGGEVTSPPLYQYTVHKGKV